MKTFFGGRLVSAGWAFGGLMLVVTNTHATDVYVNGDDCGSLSGAGLQISTSGSAPRIDVTANIPNSTVQCGLGSGQASSCSAEFTLKAKDDAPATITAATPVTLSVAPNDSYLVNASQGVSLASVGALSQPNVGTLQYTLNSTTNKKIIFNPNDSVVTPGFTNNGADVTFSYSIQQLGSTASATVRLKFDVSGNVASSDCQGYPELPLDGGNFRATVFSGQEDIYCINKPAVRETLKVTVVNHTTLSGVTGQVGWRTGVSTTPGDTDLDANDRAPCYAGPSVELSQRIGATVDGTGTVDYYCYVKADSVSFLTIKNASKTDTGGYNLSIN